MSNGPRFAIVEARVNNHNRSAVASFARLVNASTERKLKPAECKRFGRLQTQLMRQGAIILLTRQVITAQARALYSSLPWWKKLSLRVRYHMRGLRNRFAWRVERVRLRLRS